MYCMECGQSISATSKVCNKCGSNVDDLITIQSSSPTRKTVLLIILILFFVLISFAILNANNKNIAHEPNVLPISKVESLSSNDQLEGGWSCTMTNPNGTTSSGNFIFDTNKNFEFSDGNVVARGIYRKTDNGADITLRKVKVGRNHYVNAPTKIINMEVMVLPSNKGDLNFTFTADGIKRNNQCVFAGNKIIDVLDENIIPQQNIATDTLSLLKMAHRHLSNSGPLCIGYANELGALINLPISEYILERRGNEILEMAERAGCINF